METLKNSETLSEGLVISEPGQAQNHCDETLEGVSGLTVSVEQCPEPVSPPVGSVEENDCGIDSGSKVELSKCGISLFVELNGSAQGVFLNDLVKNVLSGNNSNQENLWVVNGSSLPNYEVTLMESPTEVDGGEVTGAEESMFNVDDMVWAKTKPQLWTPGVIYDPSNATKDATNREQRNSLLVRCFGNSSFAWCLPTQLKSFLENFEQMSKQSNSKSFVGALEKALAEVGRRVKMEMTCTCLANGLEDKKGNIGKFCMNQFKPANFIGRIKSLALNVSGPDEIESIVTQSCLSAFYRSIGHMQIPLHQLKQANDSKDIVQEGTKLENKDEELTKIFGEDPIIMSKTASVSSKSRKSKVLSYENGYRSSDGKSGRERRKSRFLSYPYVNSLGQKGSKEDEVEDFKTDSRAAVDTKNVDSQSGRSAYIVKSDGKKSQRKCSRKTSTGDNVSSKPVEISESSADVLSELRFTAINCLYPRGNKQFDSVERFISGFRKSTFHDFLSEIAGEHAIGQEFDHEMPPSETLPEVEVQPDKGMASTLGAGGDDLLKQSLSSVLPKKRGRKKKEKVLDSKTFPTSILSDPTCGSMMIDFQNIAPEVAGSNQELQQAEIMPLDGNYTILNFGDPQVTGPPLGKLQPKRRKKKEEDAFNWGNGDKAGSFLQEVKVMGPCSIQTFPELNIQSGSNASVSMHLNFEAPAGRTDITGYNAGQSQMGILSPASNLEPKKRKRKRKEKAPGLQNNVASAIPDLNGIGAEGKPPKKKRKRINKAEACIDYNKLQNNGVSGTALLLKFGPGHPLPSKEALFSAFCGFGPLKEPETQVLEDSEIAQVVFESSSNALDAFRSLEKNSPFGPALVNFQLHNFSGGASQGLEGSKTLSVKVSGGKSPQQKEAKDLPGIRNNLEMMTSMLEKAGDNLSREMREKLENEVKGLLKKVSDMVGSSSSSS